MKFITTMLCSLLFFINLQSRTITQASEAYLKALQSSKVNNNAETGNGLITIDASGYYYLIENLIADPSFNNTILIDIAADNVLLDFNGYAISQLSTNTIQFTGINIQPGLSNIEIINGTITQINGIGIDVKSDCKNINLKDITVSDCKNIGINFDSLKNSSLSECLVESCESSDAGSDVIGLNLEYCKNILIDNCKFYNNSASTNYNAYGVYLYQCKNCKLSNCNFSNNSGDIAGGLFITNDSDSCFIQDCVANDNIGLLTISSGFRINESSSNSLSNCSASSNIGKTNAYGFYITGTASKFNLCKDCKAKNQASRFSGSISTGSGCGFYSTSGTGNQFINCVALGNTGGNQSSSIGAGFVLDDETTSSIANSISKTNNGSTGTGYGIFLTNGSTKCVITGNTLFTNTGSAASYGARDTASISDNLYTTNLAFGNTTKNYSVKAPPLGLESSFPLITALLSDLSVATQIRYENIEIK